ncbi:hypothetical protein A4S05_10235 [Nostoc sp. KVJ20]|nr:hypothetical protein A4S05_10235 [Nostoc sp. KVJ20]
MQLLTIYKAILKVAFDFCFGRVTEEAYIDVPPLGGFAKAGVIFYWQVPRNKKNTQPRRVFDFIRWALKMLIFIGCQHPKCLINDCF